LEKLMKATVLHTVSRESEAPHQLFTGDGKLGFVLRQIDLIAITIVLLGTCFLGLAAVAFAVIQLARLVSNHWAQPADRWLVMILALAIVWVIVRWKRSSPC
jgi:hypothetical protein